MVEALTYTADQSPPSELYSTLVNSNLADHR